MLEPHDRRVLLDALRPPEGYRLDGALATTYTLDLITLLGAQLSFSVHDFTSAGGQAADREAVPQGGMGATALLQAVRENAERVAVFCQGGAIKPARYRPLLTYLEESIVEVRAPKGGIFHPKMWVERFVGRERDDDVVYRVLIGTRNLSFDRSWDSLLVLEGPLTSRTNAFSRNRPLSDFVAALPDLALRKVPRRVKKLAERLADDLRVVDLEVPAGFDDLAFWPIGVAEKERSPFQGRVERMMVMSPFLTPELLGRLTSQGTDHLIISRPEELERMPPSALAPFGGRCFVLDERAEEERAAPESGIDPEEPASGPESADVRLGVPSRGLHAKLYVADDGWNAHVWTGSANATGPAFESNVELLVQLTGKKSKVGVEAILDMGGAVSLRTVLAPFKVPERQVEADPLELELEMGLRRATATLGCAVWDARIVLEPENAQERFRVELSAKGIELPKGVTRLAVRPITLGVEQTNVLAVERGVAAATFTRLSFQALTSFFVLDVALEKNGKSAQTSFVVNARLSGAPEDRGARVLQSILDDPAKVLRFLFLLLALDPDAAFEGDLGARGSADGAAGDRSWESTPMLEALLRALDRDPERLVEFERTVRELRATREGERLVPAELDSVWRPIWSAYETMQRRSRSVEASPEVGGAS